MLTSDLLVRAYAAGHFPMAESRQSAALAFYQPISRGVFELSTLRIPRRLARTLRRHPFSLAIDRDFASVIAACAQAQRKQDDSTWINGAIERAFNGLHQAGQAHSLEAYDHEGHLVGGLYGLHLGGVFFGESMFSRVTDASKACLIALFAHLRAAGFTLVDAQLPNPHLRQFGLQVWPNADFLARLTPLTEQPCRFPSEICAELIDQFIQSTTQTS